MLFVSNKMMIGIDKCSLNEGHAILIRTTMKITTTIIITSSIKTKIAINSVTISTKKMAT